MSNAQILMTIGKNEAGQLTVAGPLHDKVMCYGLLEAAKDAVRSHVVDPKPDVWVPPPGTKIPEPPPNGRRF